MSAAASIVRQARRAAALTQRELAGRAKVPQSSVARVESGQREPGAALLERLVAATGHRLIAIPTRSPTVAESAQMVASCVERGADAEAFRLLIQLCDTLGTEPLLTRGSLCVTAAPLTGDRRFDAFIAAAVEHFLAIEGLPVPSWTGSPERFVRPLWFVAGIPGYEADAFLTAPSSFFRHGVMINSSELASA